MISMALINDCTREKSWTDELEGGIAIAQIVTTSVLGGHHLKLNFDDASVEYGDAGLDSDVRTDLIDCRHDHVAFRWSC